MLKLVSLVCLAVVCVTSQETESNESCGPQTINYNYFSKDGNPVGGPSIQTQAEVLQGRPGKMGSRGFKGEKGDQGEAGVPDNSVVDSLRNELANLTAELVKFEEKRNETATEFQRQLDDLKITKGCPGVTFHLPRDNQVTDYVQYRAYIPQMKEVTICAWIETEDYDNHATFYSYASTRRDFSHAVFEGRQKVHICGWYSSINEECGLNINGIEILSKRFSRGVVRGGGSLILGQEQDGHNAQSLDASQAFSGNITNFMMWPRVLSSQEILGIATNCECPHDYSVAMTMNKSELHGETSYSIPRKCPTL